MSKTNKINGLRVKTRRKLEKEKTVSHLCDQFKTEKVPVIFIESERVDNCKDGDIDACQNASWCAKCIIPEREQTEIKKMVFGQIEVVDLKAYHKDPLSRGYKR